MSRMSSASAKDAARSEDGDVDMEQLSHAVQSAVRLETLADAARVLLDGQPAARQRTWTGHSCWRSVNATGDAYAGGAVGRLANAARCACIRPGLEDMYGDAC